MPSVLKMPQRVVAANQFFSYISDVGTNVYAGIGRSTAWADDNNPPTPIDSVDEEDTYWAALTGIKEIKGSETSLVIPKILWASGQTDFYTTFDTSSDTAFSSNFYTMNSSGFVYECTTAPAATPTAVEPTGTGTNFATGDGFFWTYLYTVDTLTFNRLSSQNWMYVDPTFAHKLGAHSIICYCKLEEPAVDTELGSGEYRQVALLINPQISGGGDATGPKYAAGSLETTLTRGVVQQIDNRGPINRQAGQSEEIFIVISM